jgi:hypothetical protein
MALYSGQYGETSSALNVGSQREWALILALRSFADAHFSRAEQDSLNSIRFDCYMPGTARQRALRWMTDKQKLALDAAQFATRLEVQRRIIEMERRVNEIR